MYTLSIGCCEEIHFELVSPTTTECDGVGQESSIAITLYILLVEGTESFPITAHATVCIEKVELDINWNL